MRHPRSFLLALSFLSPLAFADTLFLQSGQSVLKYDDITINGIEGDQIKYTIRGNPTLKPVSQVAKLLVKDEPALNAAEEAFSNKDWEKAVQGYETATRSAKPWVKDWAAQRLLDAANKGGRFDMAAKAFIALAERSPEAARSIKLNMPAANSAFLNDAVRDANTALARKITDESKEVLLDFLIEVHNAKNDSKGASEVLTKRMQLKAADPNSPEGQRAAALLKLQGARIALTGKEYDKVIQSLEQDGAALIEPADQAEALWLLAEARNAKAGTSADANLWKDVALAYMRVVAHAPSSSPQVPAALLRVAQIHEQKLNEKKTALAIYEQVATDYKTMDAGKQAAREAQRLKQG